MVFQESASQARVKIRREGTDAYVQILFESACALASNKPRFPCGMCGVGEAIGLDLDSNTVTSDACCYMWVKGKKGHYSCRILGRGEINLTTAAKCSLAHPCTNRPFKCTEEDCDKFVWTYNMSDHYKDMHAGIEM